LKKSISGHAESRFRRGGCISLPLLNIFALLRTGGRQLFNPLNFAKFFSIRKEAILSVPYEVYSMLLMFYCQENPGSYTCKKSAKTDTAKIREILAPCCKEGLASNKQNKNWKTHKIFS
jgi:hypothetical protein